MWQEGWVMIFDREPGDWKELQTMVAQAFCEMNFDARVSVEVPLVRGKKEIDVLVREEIDRITTLVFIECKFWNSAVPQEIVHGFRTVVADGGAHKGYIIAKTGFQSGAYEVSDKTNVEVLTWEEFNKLYFPRWQRAANDRITSHDLQFQKFREQPLRMTETQSKAWHAIFQDGLRLTGNGFGRVLYKLDNGPYQMTYPEPDPSMVEIEDFFWQIKTHREFYDYMVPRLERFARRMDEWTADYEGA